MAKPDGQAPVTEDPPNRVEAIEADLHERFPEAELKIARYADHVDVRIVPHELAADLEQVHDSIEVTPYHALKLTIQLDT